MKKWQKIGLVLLIIGTLGYVKFAFFDEPKAEISTEEPQVEERVKQAEKNAKLKEKISKSCVNIYFIGTNSNKEEVYKIVKRKYDAKKDGTKLHFAIKSLFQGPQGKEKSNGIYSEIPQDAKLISIDEKPDKVIINVTEAFEQGGGTDSLYKRLYQLIKTVNKNTKADVYLYINGQQTEVFGGEGIMLNQPLSTSTLD